MAKRKTPDKTLLAILGLIILWGAFTLATVSFPYSIERYGNSWHYFIHQLFAGFLPGIILALAFYYLDLKRLKKWSPYILAANIILMALVFMPGIGIKTGGARRWLDFKLISFQPSEFLKISFLLYLSAWLSNQLKRNSKNKKTKNKHWHALVVSGITISILAAILILQPDFSTLVIIFLSGLGVYFVTKTPLWHTILMMISAGGAGALLIRFTPYRMARVKAIFNQHLDPLGANYQLRQAWIAIGSGKLFGIGNYFGLGLSRQKFGFLPEAMSDSIFAIIGEEIGFIGVLALILLFLALAWRGLKVSLNSNSEFSRLLGIGIVCWLTIQALFNIGGIIGILPIAGIPLPFFSYGSSHLIIEMIGAGILLNISRGQ